MSLQLVRDTTGLVLDGSAQDAVAEANHRIANSLSLVAGLVRMHAADIAKRAHAIGNEEVRILLHEIEARIETIGRLHRLLANAEGGTAIVLPVYLRLISEAVVASLAFAGQARLSHTSGAEYLLEAKRALPVGLIVSELVTNAVKHAHPSGVAGNISLRCRRDETMDVVEVADDGVGLPEGFDPNKDGGLGMRLARSLADQLRAKLVFRDTGMGLSVELRMPA